VDVLIDKLLEDKLKATGDSTERQKLQALQGKIAIDNARLVYQEFKRLFEGPRFERLRQQGARVQRPLWASTSAKNPAYRDVLYAEELIGPYTVDTMTPKTIESFRDHGRVRYSLEENIPQARVGLSALTEIGLSYDQITQQLQDEGVQKFADSFDKLFTCIENKRKSLLGKTISHS
jgi:transaldolase